MKTPEPLSRSTPEYLFWYGCRWYILYLRVLINRAIRKNGIGVLEEDAAVRKMRADLLFNCFLLETGDYREKDGKKICTIRAIDLNVWRKDGGKRDRMEDVILHILGSARRKKKCKR